MASIYIVMQRTCYHRGYVARLCETDCFGGVLTSFEDFIDPPLCVQKPFPSIRPNMSELPAEKEPVDRIIGSAFEPESYALHAIALPISCSDSRQILSSKLQSNSVVVR